MDTTADTTTTTTASFASIGAADLASALRANSQVLVIDVRTLRSFNDARVKGALSVRLSKLLMRRLNSGRISIDDVIVDRDQLWASRPSGSCLIVCYDDHSRTDQKPLSSTDPLNVVMRSLLGSKMNAVFLEGGLAEFESSYPDLVEQSVGGPCSLLPSLGTLCVKKKPQLPALVNGHSDSHPLQTPCSRASFDVSALAQPQHQQHQHQQQAYRRASVATCGSSRAAQQATTAVASSSSSTCSSTSSSLSASSNSCGLRTCFTMTETYHQAAHRRPQVSAALNLSCPAPTTPYNSVMEAPISRVRDYLFIGAQRDACNLALLQTHGITRIINVTRDCDNAFEKNPQFRYLQIRISDTWNQKLQEKFPSAFSFIDEARRAGERVLVHCKAGVSRSAAIVIGYLMYSEKMTLDEAHVEVRSKRDIISPNLDFMGELKEYEDMLRSVCCSS
ncbi:dual specificity phosphatase 6 [Salpingoeca rosetta]|uniref:Dual specificity phosphatase 6 n=1 Tax=Salpingoeca rosetta (strain ATCC 50818 / BSB-021) TaxID=946362 RepID=F2U8W9_SALR5|nr:dual specificity phosphatase 6 [Salpingoeca rosetta]EGD73172.1 dual specificity phosphatase 6 [Salpingoeca rosetta]|eukprot:XP_004994203.1 dual specificity phosphatase 6 [Salpingoeca rosetta]